METATDGKRQRMENGNGWKTATDLEVLYVYLYGLDVKSQVAHKKWEGYFFLLFNELDKNKEGF